MKVEVIRSTDKPEQLICQAARGDYLDGYVGDVEYEELMEPVDYDQQDLDAVQDYINQRGSDWIDEHMVGSVETAARTRSLIHKQLSRGHYGPAEHPQITFSVKGVSRVTMAQITRHRHITFDVQSQRYVDFSDKEAIVPPSLTDPDGHFSRETGNVDVDYEEIQSQLHKYREHTKEAFNIYEDMVDSGIPKEDARFILPVGTPVNMTFSGNARTFLHLLDMRRKANAQHEIRELSEALLDELFEWCPYTFNYYEEHGPNKLSP